MDCLNELQSILKLFPIIKETFWFWRFRVPDNGIVHRVFNKRDHGPGEWFSYFMEQMVLHVEGIYFYCPGCFAFGVNYFQFGS